MSNSTNTNQQNNNQNQGSKPTEQGFYEHKTWSDRIDILAHWVVDLVALVPSFVAAVAAQFLRRGGSGAKILGALGFGIGTLLSTDGIWQTMFQGTPLFPWFERDWIGWGGWITLPFNLLFWISLAISALIQIMEEKTLRGKSPEQARQEFEQATQYTLPQQPKNTIDYTRALWGDYKVAGMKERHSGGLIALFFWSFDIVTTFVGRWPFSFTNPATIIACLVYNFGTMVAGEIGYNIWKQVKN